ncbi:MAG: hypothetical protein K8T26_04210 [Lentisphaerae bacterium]|nr:hypothetical protein [Lentisphaerota bacterium]
MPGCERRVWLGLMAVVALGLWGQPAAVEAAGTVQINATLIRASNDAGKGGAKPRLPGILNNFKSYQNYGGGSASASIPGRASIGLGHGNSLVITVSPSSGNQVEAGINWRGPSGPVLNTVVRLTRGGPPVYLGGAQQDGGTMIISVSAR